MSDGIQFVSDVEDITKMRAAHLLIEAGFKYWMGEKVKQHIRQQLAANEQERLVRNSFIFLLRKWAREQRLDINKIF